MVHAAAHGGRLSGRFGFRRHRGTAARSRLRVFRQLHGGRHPALLDYGLRPAAHAAHVALLLRDGYAVLHVFSRSGQGERARADAGALGKLGRRAGRRAGVGKAVHICGHAVPQQFGAARAVLDRLMRAVTGAPISGAPLLERARPIGSRPIPRIGRCVSRRPRGLMRNELHGWSQMETTRVNLSGGRDGYSCAVQFERENRRCDRCFRGPWRGRRAGDGLCGGQRGGVLQLRQGTAGHSDLRNRRRGCGDKALQGKFVQPGRDPGNTPKT